LTENPIRTVIIPAAGKGTRLLPATKVTAKELLPVYDRVVLDFAIAEAVGLGAQRIVVVISPEKASIKDYLFDQPAFRAPVGVSRALPELVFVSQDQPQGLGHAVLCCKDVVLPGPVVVLLPDDLIFGSNCLVEMSENYTGGNMIAAMQVRPEETSQYGIFRLRGPQKGNCFPASGMVEKPSVGNAPSALAAVGRYVLDPAIFAALERTVPGKGGEVQLTDAIASLSETIPIMAFKFSGTRHDCGNHDGLLAASVARKAICRQELATAPGAASYSDTPASVVRAMMSHVKVLGQTAYGAGKTASVDTQ
jgi:UTP--glucose-1-phosphate uridylyltransferase